MICEICVDSIAGVRAAKQAGARRVELCADLLEGGITPSLGVIRQARKVSGIDLNVMIRPRGGDFLFNEDEFATMRADIETAKAEGANGVVIGLLTAAGEVDIARTRELAALARPLSVTFHRAFDVAAEPFRALETLIELGVDRVLTSGQEPTAYEGAERIAELIKASVDRVIVMPGAASAHAMSPASLQSPAQARSTSPRACRRRAPCATAAPTCIWAASSARPNTTASIPPPPPSPP